MWEEPENESAAKPPAIYALIPKALTPTARELDSRLLKAIKSTVRSSDAEATAAVPALMTQMRKQDSQVRYLALLIIDELFMRSKLFRSVLVPRLDEFLTLSVGFRTNLPLPPPSAVASALRSKSIELLEKWNDSFGLHYRQLRLGFDYLKNTLHFRFPNRLANETRMQRERREKEARTKQILLDKFDRLKESYSSIEAEVRSTVNEIGECLDILQPEEDDFAGSVPPLDEVEEFKSLALHRIRQESLKEGEKVHENSENRAVFDALRESHRLLVSKHLPAVKEWISVLGRVDLANNKSRDAVADNRFRDTALKELIDLRNLIQSVEQRCDQLGCSLVEKLYLEEEEDLWEEGTIEINVPEDSSAPKSSIEGSVVDPTTSKAKGKGGAPPGGKKPSDGVGSSLTSERLKLLAEAPVMAWGLCLDNWGSGQDALANQRGLELEGHWGRVDYDAVIPAEKIAELNVHRTVYKEQAVEIQPCRVPLKKGGLCQRKDLRVCPFHGPIILRDDEGNPIEQTPCEGETEMESSTQPKESSTQGTNQINDSTDTESSPELVQEMVDQLAKQAVKNVRERDSEMKSLKRAKLAKIRKHNEVVLREAALASTSYSEHSAHEHETSAQVKEPTSASRLRKKATTKDRIAQKLLNTRATEASVRQLMQGEHSRYREAFPNQW